MNSNVIDNLAYLRIHVDVKVRAAILMSPERTSPSEDRKQVRQLFLVQLKVGKRKFNVDDRSRQTDKRVVVCPDDCI